MDNKETDFLNKKEVWIAGGILTAVTGFVVWYSLARGHLKKKREEKRNKKTGPDSVKSGTGKRSSRSSPERKPTYELEVKPFHPNYKAEALKATGKKLLVLKESTANDFAKKIYDAWGYLNDDEDAIYWVFDQLKDKVQVSQVAAAYQKNHGKNLWSRLDWGLLDRELQKVKDRVDDLPDYRLA